MFEVALVSNDAVIVGKKSLRVTVSINSGLSSANAALRASVRLFLEDSIRDPTGQRNCTIYVKPGSLLVEMSG